MYSTDDSMVQTAEITRSTLLANQGSALAFLGGPAAAAITGSSVAGAYLLSVDARIGPIVVDVTASGSALRGASLVMPAEGGGQHAVRLALRDNSAWLTTGDSNLTRLESIGSAVAFVPPTDGAFHSLTLGGYHSEGGALGLMAALAGDGSPADKLVIDGGTVTGATALRIVNAGGKGALTSEGIRVIEAINGGSAPAGTFALAGRAVAGPYEYRLYRGSTQNPADGNWYLRSQQLTTPPDPPAPPTPPDPRRPQPRSGRCTGPKCPPTSPTSTRPPACSCTACMTAWASCPFRRHRADGCGWWARRPKAAVVAMTTARGPIR
ncbi:hypothetical protein CYJ10_03355 [Cupriavidus pauculus]|uniref:Autochaperone domain-containing protein n=1 Tax=Cupriavidus pauculus TaxID=82633 RepID=A0A2N5CJD9_9BURK|nr:hypothetical protein CYJ10_03355 [Cupriavidus pauculus]